MTLWFLRLFPAFVRLEGEKLRAEHMAELHARRADAAEQQAEVNQQAVEERAAHIEDLKRMVDAYAFQVTRRYVFARNEVPTGPASTPPPVTGRRFARDVVQQRTREFSKEFAEETEKLQREAEKLINEQVG